MAMPIAATLLALGMLHLLASASAAEHQVGGSYGWNWNDYHYTNFESWASGETFKVGDTLQFEFNEWYDVVEVNSTEYNMCTYSGAVAYSSPVTYSLATKKTYYYICTNECSYGMKLSVTVPSKRSKKIIVGVVVGVVGGVVLTFFCIVAYIRRTREKKPKPTEEVSLGANAEKSKDEEARLKKRVVREFTYSDLYAATLGFSEKQLLGEGGFGKVYKGILLSDDSEVAVKVMTQASPHSQSQFSAELSVIGHVRHKNLVSLRGWCHENDKLILVYDYMQNGSLDGHLFSTDKFLPWSKRYGIVKGVAEGLAYLHGGWDKIIVHRDVKAANVLLDSKFVARLGDFGLAKLMDEAKQKQSMTQAGTKGYIAPELAFIGVANEKSDIYSFGILLLEIACGRPAIENEACFSLLDWVWNAQQKNDLLQVVDPRLGTNYDEAEVALVLSLGLLCAHPDAEMRPSSKKCCLILDTDIPLPDLPRLKPAFTFLPENIISKSSSYSSDLSVSMPTISNANSFTLPRWF